MKKNFLNTNAIFLSDNGKSVLTSQQLQQIESKVAISAGGNAAGGEEFVTTANWWFSCGFRKTNEWQCPGTENSSCQNTDFCNGASNTHSCTNDIRCSGTTNANCTNTFDGASGQCPPSNT